MSFFRKFPLNRSEREREIRRRATKIGELRQDGLIAHYGYLDSTLNGHPYDESYEMSFKELFKEDEEGFVPYIMRNMGYTVPKKGMIVVDAGGPGRKIAKGLRQAGVDPKNERTIRVKRSLGITLQDVHTHESGADFMDGHTVMEGNLLVDQTEDRIDAWLGGEQIDLFFERLCSGIEALPNDPVFLAKKLNRWYGRMAEGGIMFVEIPATMNQFLEEWSKMLQEEFGHYLEVRYKQGDTNGIPGKEPAILIRKLKGAPASLPMLELQKVRDIAKHLNEASAKKVVPIPTPLEEKEG